MTSTVADIFSELDTMEEFEFAIPCGHSGHGETHIVDEDAWAYITFTTACGYHIEGYICHSGYKILEACKNFRCVKGCGINHPSEDCILTVVTLL